MTPTDDGARDQGAGVWDAHKPVTIPLYLAIESRNCLDSVASQYREMPEAAYQSVASQFQAYADEMQAVIDAATAAAPSTDPEEETT